MGAGPDGHTSRNPFAQQIPVPVDHVEICFLSCSQFLADQLRYPLPPSEEVFLAPVFDLGKHTVLEKGPTDPFSILPDVHRSLVAVRPAGPVFDALNVKHRPQTGGNGHGRS